MNYIAYLIEETKGKVYGQIYVECHNELYQTMVVVFTGT